MLERVSNQQCVGIMLDHHDRRRGWHACCRVLQAFSGAGLRVGVEGAVSIACNIAPSRAKLIGTLQRFIMDWELRVEEKNEVRHNEYVQGTVNVAPLKRTMMVEMAERYIRGRVAANVWEKMIQTSHALVDTGESYR